LYGQGFFPASRGPFRVHFSTPFTGARTLPLSSVGSPNPFRKVGIVSLQIGLQIGPDSEVHVRVSTFTLHTQKMLAHAVTVRRASEPGPCWNFSYINPTSDMLSPGWRCRIRRASTSTTETPTHQQSYRTPTQKKKKYYRTPTQDTDLHSFPHTRSVRETPSHIHCGDCFVLLNQ
jgi:hypothetical protein